MADVHVSTSAQTPEGYRFEMLIGEAGRRTSHVVLLRDDDYQRWASQGMSPAAVASQCVELMLEHERRSELPQHMDLHDVMQRYPGFEREDDRYLR